MSFLSAFENGLQENCNTLLESPNYEMPDMGSLLENESKVESVIQGKIVVVRGLPEDHKVIVDGRLAYECVYGRIYNVNNELCDWILSIHKG